MRKKFYIFFNKILIIIQKLLRRISENKKIGFNKDPNELKIELDEYF